MYLHILKTLILKFQEKHQISYSFKPGLIVNYLKKQQQQQQQKTKQTTTTTKKTTKNNNKKKQQQTVNMLTIRIDCERINGRYILAKSSNRPLPFYRFYSKPKTILQFYLHPKIGRCVSQLRHQKVCQNSQHCIQDALMNTGTPIFKIHKFQHFVTFCEKSIFEISNFHKQNHFITKAYDCRNRLMQK